MAESDVMVDTFLHRTVYRAKWQKKKKNNNR